MGSEQGLVDAALDLAEFEPELVDALTNEFLRDAAAADREQAPSASD